MHTEKKPLVNLATSGLKGHNIVDMPKRQATSRIIAGKFRGTRISFKESKALRPTESKTKETLFNWLMNDLENKNCLDMFAGTGALGFEALSRGSKNVVFFDKDKRLCSAIDRIAKKLEISDQCRVINSNSMTFDYSVLGKKFDLIFLDPPFGEDLVSKSLDLISKFDLLKVGGQIYVECEASLVLEDNVNNLKKIKSSKGGVTKYYLYES